jgi:antitoxin component of MazEF toxin-antitoxin module
MEKLSPMAITKKLSRVGKSYSLIIDKNIMQLLDINPETELEVSIQGNSLLVTPSKKKEDVSNQKNHKEKIRNAFQQSLEQYAVVYKKLAQ